MSEKYFLYVRKSTDVEDKQVLSVEAQLVELRKFARDNSLTIVDTIVEKKSAKIPGRPKFNTMLEQIQEGKADGIIAWHPDRLARNSVDGGQIIYLLDQLLLTALKFPSFWFENTSQGKFMLSMAFSQSKYYVDNLSENTKRGLRHKVRLGHYPSIAPIGYINDIRHKTIIVDRRRSLIIITAFERYAEGDQRLQDIANYLKENGITTKGGKALHRDQITRILSNPFYYGHFRYGGEVHDGKHKAIIDKQLFDRVQAILKRRSKPQKSTNVPQILCGLLQCGACKMSITAEKKIKHQKNGNVHEYVYYHCTRKNKTIRCTESAITEPDLVTQVSDIVQGYALPKSWANALTTMLDDDEKKAEQSSAVFIADAQIQITGLQDKLQRLLDSYLNQDIDQPTYRAKQAELMSEKKSLEEQIGKLTLAANAWIEPMRQWLKTAVSLKRIAKDSDLFAKKQALLEIEGLNLFLKSKKVQPTAALELTPPKNIWVLLRKTQEKIANAGDNFSKSLFLVPRAGVEPATLSLGRICSIQLSYRGIPSL